MINKHERGGIIDEREKGSLATRRRREEKGGRERYGRLSMFRPPLIRVWLRPRQPNNG
jgi:hypothetical protein